MKRSEQTLHQRRYRWQISTWKGAPSTPSVIRESRYHYRTTRMTPPKTSDNTDCQRGRRAAGTLTQHWRGRQMVRPPWKTVRQLLTKLNIVLPPNSVTVFLGVSPNELKLRPPQKSAQMFVTAVFINCQKLEATNMSSNRWAGKQTVLHLDRETWPIW